MSPVSSGSWSEPFGTFVYSPDVAVYVASEKSGVIDLTPDIVKVDVHRRVSAVSSISIELNNKRKKYDGVLQRMDRVTVFMKRVSWVQVFSGYLTDVPYITVVPGNIVVEAECTIRRLSYTYWDPNAEENIFAFYPNGGGTALEDGGTAATVYKLLTAVAGWDTNRIWIQEIPDDFIAEVAKVVQKAQEDWAGSENPQVLDILRSYLGGAVSPTGQTVTAPGTTTVADSKINGTNNPIRALPFPRPGTQGVKPYIDSWGYPRSGGRTHEGTDIMMPMRTPLYAAADGTVERTSNDLGGTALRVRMANGDYFYYAHLVPGGYATADRVAVKAGQLVAYSGDTGNAAGNPHLHFGYYIGGGDYATNPYPYLKAAESASTVTPASQSRDPDTGELIRAPGDVTVTVDPGQTVAVSSAFNYAWQTFEADVASGVYMGDRAWLNDTPLQQSIKTICAASLREFQSAPNGDFVAWFPDKYGMNGKTPALSIRDIEVMDFKVSIGDKNLRTHVAVAGTGYPEDPTVGIDDWVATLGIVSVQKPEIMKLLLGLDPDKLYSGLDGEWILRRFGMRPYKEEAPEIHDPVWEFLKAYQVFQQFWTSQFSASVEFTFMPEMYPGMRVELADRGVSFYVDQVDHTAHRSMGFTTRAVISCPMTRGEDGTWSIIPIERMPEEIPYEPGEQVVLTAQPRVARPGDDLGAGLL